MSKASDQQLLQKILTMPKYRGKHVVIVGDEIHVLSTKNKKERAALLTQLTKKYPHEAPLITVVPKQNTLILVH